MTTSLSSLVTVCLWLYACTHMHINKMDNDYDYLDLEAVLLVTDTAKEANESAKRTHEALKNIAPINIIPCLKKGDARANTDQDRIKSNLTKIQAKRDKVFPNSPRHQQRLFNIIAIEGVMHKVWTDAAKLILYALAMYIALNQPHCILRDHMVKLVTAILENTIAIHNKDDLENWVKEKLKYPTLTINHFPGSHIIDRLQSMLKSAHATIDKIDADFLEVDDVFVQPNKGNHTKANLAFLYDQAFTAFTEANNTHQAFQNAWNPIHLTDHCFLEALQHQFDATIQARDTANRANNAYYALAKYFEPFKQVIQTMLDDCTAWFTPTIQKKLSRCDECVETTAPMLDNTTVPLGVDLKAVQEVVDKLNEAIMKCYKDVQEGCNKLDKAIVEVDATANLYNACYRQYNTIVDAIHTVSIHNQTDQTSKTD